MFIGITLFQFITTKSVFLPLGFVLKASHNGTWPIRLLGQLISPKTKVTYRAKIYFYPRRPHVIPLVLVNLTFTQTYEAKNYFLTVVSYIYDLTPMHCGCPFNPLFILLVSDMVVVMWSQLCSSQPMTFTVELQLCNLHLTLILGG